MTDKKKSNPKKILKDLSGNYWAISTIVLAIILVAILITGNTSTMTIGASEAGQKVLSFANAQGANAKLINSEEDGSLYLVTLSINGQDVPVYVTKDGENLIPSLIPLTGQATQNQNTPTQQPTEIQKSDTPKAQLYIWSYCPYGVTALSPFAEVSKLLGENANFEVILYHNGHGDHETQQNKIQECIQKYEPTKYNDYAIKFVEDIYPACGQTRDATCDKEESTKLMNELGIDSSKIFKCVENEGETLFNADVQKARNAGVTGSPTLVINDAKTNTARNAEAYKTEICNAFNNAPAECSNTLNAQGSTASGNC